MLKQYIIKKIYDVGSLVYVFKNQIGCQKIAWKQCILSSQSMLFVKAC